MGHFKSQYDVFNKKHTLWWDIPNQWQNQKHPIPILLNEVYQLQCYAIDIIHQLIRNIIMGGILEQRIHPKDAAILFTKVMLIGCLSAQRECI